MPKNHLDAFFLDLRFTARQLKRDRAFATAAIVTLALGIGATATLFTVLQAVVLNPLPFPQSHRLMDLATRWQEQPGAISTGDYFLMKGRSRAFALIAARTGGPFNLSEGGDPERVQGARVTANIFPLFGIEPALGRVFTEAEDAPGQPHVALLSAGLFTRRFGGDRSVLGSIVHLSGVPYEVVGIMPDSFRPPGDTTEVWVPIAMSPATASFDAHYLTVTARLNDGATDERVEADRQALTAAMLEAAPRENNGRTLLVTDLLDRIVGAYRPRLFILLGTVSLVFLIACVNVASLLLARGAGRQREIAVRAALGAGRFRIARQLMTEAFVLCMVGAGAGLLLAAVALPVFVAKGPADLPRLAEARINAPVLFATTAFALLATLLAGLAPALRESRAGLSAGAGQAFRGAVGGVKDRVRQAFVAAEVALALMLLTSAGLLIQSALNLDRLSPGFDAASLLSARIALPIASYPGEEKPANAVARIVEALGAQPGVLEAAASTRPPLIGDVSYGLRIDGRADIPENRIDSRMQLVTAGYLETMRVPVRAGRTFTNRDQRPAARVMIVNETLARLAWPGEDPMGRRVACCEGGPSQPVWKEVIGVVADTKARGLATPGLPEFYLPMDQAPARAFEANGGSITLVARARGVDAEALAPLIRSSVRSVDPTLPLYDSATMASRVASSTAMARFNRLLLTCLGLVGLALAALGIYGVIAYLAAQRTREMGVRMALGAVPADIARLVFRQALGPVAIGMALGAAGAFAQGRIIETLTFGISGRDPWTFLAAATLLLGVAVAASVVPCWRASRTDPASALAEP